eukprot:scaffold362983_cov16-Prasinocladus_malaysianus.AAC.1
MLRFKFIIHVLGRGHAIYNPAFMLSGTMHFTGKGTHLLEFPMLRGGKRQPVEWNVLQAAFSTVQDFVNWGLSNSAMCTAQCTLVHHASLSALFLIPSDLT